jgi:TolB protein
LTRSRLVVVAALVTLALGLVVVRWQTNHKAGLASLVPPVVSDLPTRPVPTATPAWTGSPLALVVQDGPKQTLWLMAAGGDDTPRQLLTGFDGLEGPVWSPDGASLALAGLRDGNWDLYRIAGDGSGLTRLTDHPAFDGSPAWSPDGSRLAFSSARDGAMAIYQLALGSPDATATRLAGDEGPAIEPAWSPDGAWLAYAAWADGRYRLDAVPAGGGASQTLAEPEPGMDLRAPAWSPDGRQLAYLESRYGNGRLTTRPWQAATGRLDGAATQLATQANAFAWFPDGSAVAVLAATGRGRQVDVRPTAGFGRQQLASLPEGPAGLSWARGALAPGLPLAVVAHATPVADASDARPGLAVLTDVDVSGTRIHAGLAPDFAALRAEVAAATGRDFLGTLSDAWRPLSFKSSGSAFFSWHKTGRAFDTQMELRGPGGRRDMTLVREDLGGRTMWRMYLRAGVQDGSVGRPLTEPGWVFAAATGDDALEAEGGRRGETMPAGYWVDFTRLADRYGWRRIAGLTQANLNWHRDWVAIEYWHYERRDGLRWFEAARQVYSDLELLADLHPDRLRALDVSLARLARLGFPAGWGAEG